MLTVIAAINEFERANLLERQREGVQIAKSKGVYKGRKPITFTEDEFSAAYEDYKARKITKAMLAKRLDISRPTLYKILSQRGLS